MTLPSCGHLLPAPHKMPDGTIVYRSWHAEVWAKDGVPFKGSVASTASRCDPVAMLAERIGVRRPTLEKVLF